MNALLRVSPPQPRYTLLNISTPYDVSKRFSLSRNFNSVFMKNFSNGPVFPTLKTSYVPPLKPLVGSSRGACRCMNAAELNQRFYEVVAELNIGSSHTVPIPSLTSPPSPQPTAVVIISRFVLEFLKHHDEEIMMKLKSLCDVPPRINEYMECYGLLLEKFKVLEKGNKFIVSFSLFVSIFMIFDHVYYGVKMLERMTNKSDKQDLKAPILFKVVEIFKILLILGYTLIMWLYSKITSCSFTPLLQFLETIIKELEDES